MSVVKREHTVHRVNHQPTKVIDFGKTGAQTTDALRRMGKLGQEEKKSTKVQNTVMAEK